MEERRDIEACRRGSVGMYIIILLLSRVIDSAVKINVSDRPMLVMRSGNADSNATLQHDKHDR